ncbi:MAG: ABC transporter ATP-binding protein [Planctomycetota bacterium]|nr:MAG: ABC transporter ATP-binding protein [Planctomycetota bacterium]
MRLQAQHLAKAFDALHVLTDTNLQVAAGEAVAIRGASGTGKSTLLNCLGLLDRPDSGSILLDGEDLGQLRRRARGRVRGRRIGFIFQAFHLLPEFTVRENVLMAARCAGLPTKHWHERCSELLGRLGLQERAHADVRILSGGERQRVALARALLLRPQLVLADEPTGNLDPHTAATVLEIMLDLVRDEQSSLVLVTHDASVAAYAHRQLELRDGQLHALPATNAANDGGPSLKNPG